MDPNFDFLIDFCSAPDNSKICNLKCITKSFGSAIYLPYGDTSDLWTSLKDVLHKSTISARASKLFFLRTKAKFLMLIIDELHYFHPSAQFSCTMWSASDMVITENINHKRFFSVSTLNPVESKLNLYWHTTLCFFDILN
jgi:hypothetical protein